jgi:hypothetical protein
MMYGAINHCNIWNATTIPSIVYMLNGTPSQVKIAIRTRVAKPIIAASVPNIAALSLISETFALGSIEDPCFKQNDTI